jgi:hypothetical protein
MATALDPSVRHPARPATTAGARWRRWALVLVAVAAALAMVWPLYWRLDPATAIVNLPAKWPWKYPLLIGHIVTGSVALLALLAQAFPPVRRNVRVHARIGRAYVYGGVLPSAAAAAILLTTNPGPGWTGRLVLELGWVVCTVGAVVAVARGRLVLHRRLMAYSAALTLDAFSVRFLERALPALFGDHMPTTVFFYSIAWGGWTVNVLVAHLWVQRSLRRRRAAAESPAPAAAPSR